MNRLSMVICILLLTAMVVGYISCNHPMALIDPMSQLEKTGKSNIHPGDEIENTTSPPTIPAVIGRAMFSMDGQIIGVLFSTPEGDFCESRYGTPAGIIALKEESQSPFWAENLIIKTQCIEEKPLTAVLRTIARSEKNTH